MNPYMFQGVARGLSNGIDSLEEQRRTRRQEGRQDAADQRDIAHDERSKVTFDQETRLNDVKIGDAEAEAERKDFERKYDEGMGRFIMSDGEDTQSLESLYNDHFPDGNQVKIARDAASKKFTLDFGNGRVAKDLDFEEVVGMGSYMRDPKTYQEMQAKKAERAQKNDDEIAKEGRTAKAEEVKAERAHRYRLAEKATPGAVAPKVEIGDDGKPYALSPTGVAPVPGAAAGLTFRGADKGRSSAMIQEIDSIATRLPPVAGEDSNAHWMRAAAERAKLIGKTNPAQAVAEYEKALTAKLLDPSMVNPNNPAKLEEAQSIIKSMVEDFARRNAAGPAAPGAGAPGVYQHPDLGTITDADLQSTAQKHGITVDQVKQQLGIQ